MLPLTIAAGADPFHLVDGMVPSAVDILLPFPVDGLPAAALPVGKILTLTRTAKRTPDITITNDGP